MASKLARCIWSMGFTLCMGYGFGVFTLAGCGSSQEGVSTPANENRRLPEHVVMALTDCGRQGADRLRPIEHTVRFDVYAREEGQVDLVEVRASTLGDHAIEACMVHALQALSLPEPGLATRLEEPVPQALVAQPSRALVANPGIVVVTGGGAAQAALTFGAIGVAVVVVFYVVRDGIREHRKREKAPETYEDPRGDPEPEPQPKGDPQTTGTTPPPPPKPKPPENRCAESPFKVCGDILKPMSPDQAEKKIKEIYDKRFENDKAPRPGMVPHNAIPKSMAEHYYNKPGSFSAKTMKDHGLRHTTYRIRNKSGDGAVVGTILCGPCCDIATGMPRLQCTVK